MLHRDNVFDWSFNIHGTKNNFVHNVYCHCVQSDNIHFKNKMIITGVIIIAYLGTLNVVVWKMLGEEALMYVMEHNGSNVR